MKFSIRHLLSLVLRSAKEFDVCLDKLGEKLDYLRANPVQAGLVARADE